MFYYTDRHLICEMLCSFLLSIHYKQLKNQHQHIHPLKVIHIFHFRESNTYTLKIIDVFTGSLIKT